MNIPARLILACIGDIDELHIDEAEFAEIFKIAKRKRVVKYSAIAMAASVTIAAAVWFFRARRAAKPAKAAA